jgi:polyhydroxyalkanoate synthesis regulator phasin
LTIINPLQLESKMSERDETAGGAGPADAASEESEARSRKERMSEGFQRGLGVLSAFKDALEETISEARERGDLNKDRARTVLHDAMEKARGAASDARERFDFVGQPEFEALARRVAELEARLDNLTSDTAGPGGHAE